jgi:hypothetical protein
MSEIKSKSISTGEFNITSNNRGYKCWYTSLKTNETFYADSSLEHVRMIQLDKDRDIIKWSKRHHIKVPYTYEGVTRHCIPDFLIHYKSGDAVLEEVKGWVTDIELVKKEAIKQWCDRKGYVFRFVTQKDLNIRGEYRKLLKERKNYV